MIPAWNEEDRLERTLARFQPALARRGEPFEIIVVTDGSRDRTADVARAWGSRGVRLLEFPKKLGKGGAILEGMRAAQFEYVGYLDADGPIPPTEIAKLVDALAAADCVVASRWVRGSVIVRQEPRFNLLAGRVWNFLVRSILLVPIRDSQCGAKLLRRSVMEPTLRAIALTNRAFDIDLLYHVRKDGHRLAEVPVTWTHDPDTRLPIGWAIPVMFASLIGVRLMNLPVGRRVPKWLVSAFLERWGHV